LYNDLCSKKIRYGDNDHKKKKKKKRSSTHKHGKKGPETDTLSKLTLPEVKPPKGRNLLKIHKTPSYVAAVKEANKHHGDAGDGGVPDELVALMGDDFMDGFHYGVREF